MAEVPRPGPDPRAGGGGGGGTTDHRLLTNRDDAAEHPATSITVDATGFDVLAATDAQGGFAALDQLGVVVNLHSTNIIDLDENKVGPTRTWDGDTYEPSANVANFVGPNDPVDEEFTVFDGARWFNPSTAIMSIRYEDAWVTVGEGGAVGTDTVATFVLVDADFDPLTDPAPLSPGVPAYVFSGVDAMTGQDLEEVVRAPATFAGLWDGNTDPADLGDPGEWQLLTPHAYEAKVGDGWFSRGFFDFRTGTPTPLGKPWITDFTTPRFGYISPLSLFDSPVFELKFEETTEQVPGTESAALRVDDPAAIGLDAGSTDVRLALTDIAATKANIVNTDSDPGTTIYVGSVDPDVAFTPEVGDVWIETP